MFILGYSGHAYVVIDAIHSNNYELSGYFDAAEVKDNPYNIKYCGFEKNVDIAKIVKDIPVFPAIGDNRIRENAYRFLLKNNLKQTIVIDASATVSKKAVLQKSIFVGANAVLNSLVQIGKACIINSGAIIEHECKIGDYTHIAPGAILTGNVRVGTSSFIGAGAVIKQGVSIGNNVVIGAGSVVLNNIDDNQIWVGNPSRRLR